MLSTQESATEPIHAAEQLTSSAGRRISLVTIDQALSSASNLLVILLVAHALAPVDFGRFSILFVIYTLAQAVLRSLVSLPALVHPEDSDRRPRVVLGSALLLGGAAGALCVAAGGVMWAFGGDMGRSTVALGVCLPLLLLQDVGRYLAIGSGRPQRAIVLDTLWLILTVVGFALADRLHVLDLAWLVVAWGGSGALSALWVFVQFGIPRVGDLTLRWVRERWDFAWRNLVGSVTSQFVGLFGASMAAAVSTPASVAAIRASLLLGRPSTAVHLGVGTSTAADVAREKPNDRGLRTHQRRALAICMAVSSVNFVVLILLPDAIGRAVLGQVWPLVKPLILPAALFGFAAAGQIGMNAVMVGRREMKLVMAVDITGATLGVITMVVGAAMQGARGAVWGTLVGQLIATALWVVVYLNYLRHRTHARGRHRMGRQRAVASRTTIVFASHRL